MVAAVLGWVGTIGTIGAYVLLSRGLWHATSLRYAALNGVAGLLGAVGSSLYGAWPSAASNLLWSTVAAHSMVVTYRARRAAGPAGIVELVERDDEEESPTLELPVLAPAA